MWRFAPDVDPTTPQIYTAMTRMLPTPWGTYRTSPSMSLLAGNIGTSTPCGSELLVKLDGTVRWLVGSTSKIYDSDETGAAFTDRSGAVYTSDTNRWQFAQFGNVTIAARLANPTQASTSGNFADLTGSPPKAACITTQSGFVILGNYNDGTSVPDGVWWSDIYDHTQWTPTSGKESGYVRLMSTPGAITALSSLGSNVYAFKDSSFYRGTYVGSPVFWQWQLIHPSIGVSSGSAVASDGTSMFFFGKAGAYIYDGAQIRRIDDGIEKYLQSRFGSSMTTIACTWSADEQCFLINGGRVFSAYCPASDLWSDGVDAAAAQAGDLVHEVTRVPPGYSRRGIGGAIAATLYGYKAIGTNYSLTSSSVTTGWFGSDEAVTNVDRVTPVFVPAGDYSYANGTGSTYPSALTHYIATSRGGTMGSGVTSSIDYNNGRFNVNRTARWHSFLLTDSSGSVSGLQGGMELSGIAVRSKPAGTD